MMPSEWEYFSAGWMCTAAAESINDAFQHFTISPLIAHIQRYTRAQIQHNRRKNSGVDLPRSYFFLIFAGGSMDRFTQHLTHLIHLNSNTLQTNGREREKTRREVKCEWWANERVSPATVCVCERVLSGPFSTALFKWMLVSLYQIKHHTQNELLSSQKYVCVCVVLPFARTNFNLEFGLPLSSIHAYTHYSFSNSCWVVVNGRLFFFLRQHILFVAFV